MRLNLVVTFNNEQFKTTDDALERVKEHIPNIEELFEGNHVYFDHDTGYIKRLTFHA